MDIKQLGRYVVERVLGRGAMGVVYLARDPVIGREVALKTLSISPDAEEAEEFRQRFLREAQAAGRLNHPGIVTVHDAGVDPQLGVSFMAMEFIEGRSLKDLQRAGHAFAYSEVARIGAALAGALDYAHSKGVVHRDIKPANVIFTAQGLVKITDFGVARLESSNLTATGQFIGTPNYMSPEQVTGGAVDGRSDLFSLGVVLFELLTGTRPFVGQSLTEVTYKIVHEPAPIPSQVRPGLPPAFNPIVLKLLEKDPAKRYPRGAEVARALDALRRVLAGVTSESTQYAQPAGGPPAGSATVNQGTGSVPTQTRATELAAPISVAPAPASPQAAVAPAPRAEPAPAPVARSRAAASVWRASIAERWVAIMLAAALLPPALIVALLYHRIDRGPWPTVAAGEVERRHRAGTAQRQAADALAAGNAEQALSMLSAVFQDAPYSRQGREIRQRAMDLSGSRRDSDSRQARAGQLRDEGRDLLDQGRLREAQVRFDEALTLTPDDPLLREYIKIIRERQRLSQTSPQAPPPVVAQAVPTPVRLTGEGRLEVYFNCPLSAGSVELELDGKGLKVLPFNFYTKGFLGLKKKGSGRVEDALAVPAGERTLLVRLKAEDGKLLGEQSLPLRLQGGTRAVLKIDMEAEAASPKFTLSYPRR
jgi:eukaryotic-like serine/threonine-protein kinase